MSCSTFLSHLKHEFWEADVLAHLFVHSVKCHIVEATTSSIFNFNSLLPLVDTYRQVTPAVDLLQFKIHSSSITKNQSPILHIFKSTMHLHIIFIYHRHAIYKQFCFKSSEKHMMPYIILEIFDFSASFKTIREALSSGVTNLKSKSRRSLNFIKMLIYWSFYAV